MKKLTQSLLLAIFTIAFVNFTASAEPVQHITNGDWVYATGTSPAYWEEKGFWVDVKIENIAFEKEVIIRWTDDNWATSTDSYCSYENALESNYEQWGLDFAPIGRLDSYYIGSWENYITGTTRAGGTSVRIEYSILYRVNVDGTWVEYWDNNGGKNYNRTLELTN